jgi:hypothetical protein
MRDSHLAPEVYVGAFFDTGDERQDRLEGASSALRPGAGCSLISEHGHDAFVHVQRVAG